MNQLPNCEECRAFYQSKRDTLVRLMNDIAAEESIKTSRKVEYGDRVVLTREITRGDLIAAFLDDYHKNEHSILLPEEDDDA